MLSARSVVVAGVLCFGLTIGIVGAQEDAPQAAPQGAAENQRSFPERAQAPQPPEFPREIPKPIGDVPKGEIPKEAKPQTLQQRVANLENHNSCRQCKGIGEHLVPFVKGKRRDGGVLRDVIGHRWENCELCGTTGYPYSPKGKHTILHNAMEMVTKAWSEMDREARQAEAIEEKAITALRETLKNQPWTVETVMNKPAIDDAAAGKLKQGDPMFLVGWVVQDEPLGEGHGRTKLVTLVRDGRATVYVLILEPLYAEALLHEKVICGGRFAGHMKCDANKDIIVLTDGYVVSDRR